MHGLRAGAPRREFEQFVRTAYLMGQGRFPRGAHLRKDQRLDPRAAPGAFSMQHGLLPKEGLPARLLA
jgi:hypothetical protein